MDMAADQPCLAGIPLQKGAQRGAVAQIVHIHREDAGCEGRVMHPHHHGLAREPLQRLLHKHQRARVQRAVMGALDKRIEGDEAEIGQICRPVDRAGGGHPAFAREGLPQSLAPIMIAGHHTVGHGKRAHDLAKAPIFLRRAEIGEIARDDGQIHRAEERQIAVERGHRIAQRGGRIDDAIGQLALGDDMRIGELENTCHWEILSRGRSMRAAGSIATPTSVPTVGALRPAWFANRVCGPIPANPRR